VPSPGRLGSPSQYHRKPYTVHPIKAPRAVTRDPELEDWLARAREHDEPPREDGEDEDYAPLTAEELAEIEEAAADELLGVKAATSGRRGPGQRGSARTFPGESCSPAASFGPGMTLDVLPGCAGLAVAADAADTAGDGGFAGVSEAELIGVLCAWDRMEAHAHARKLAAVAELARRNPGTLDTEFTADQLACALGESRARADSLIGMAQTLPVRLPGTAAALLEGTISRYKAEIIARATALLENDEARAAEAEVLDRTGPRPRQLRRGQPQEHLVPDRHRPARPRGSPRLRSPRTQESRETRRTRAAGRDRVQLHPGRPGQPARRVRNLAAPHPRTRAGPDHHHRPDHHRSLRPPVPGPGS
jgi:Domain of unknown function (DUF222)